MRFRPEIRARPTLRAGSRSPELVRQGGLQCLQGRLNVGPVRPEVVEDVKGAKQLLELAEVVCDGTAEKGYNEVLVNPGKLKEVNL